MVTQNRGVVHPYFFVLYLVVGKISLPCDMDKPTSEKDVIKQLDSEHRLRNMSNEDLRLFSIKQVKPVFDKIIYALKGLAVGELDQYNESDMKKVNAIIKEAEELGL